MDKITPAYLRECFSYDPETGSLTWLHRPDRHFSETKKIKPSHRAAIWNAQHAGKDAFSYTGNHGYKVGGISGKKFLAHRVAWAIFHGSWPTEEVDHLDHVRTNNAISNLRQASRSENAKNLTLATGRDRGVCWYKQTKRWRAGIQSDKVYIHLGYFLNKDDALAARKIADEKYGFHKNHGGEK